MTRACFRIIAWLAACCAAAISGAASAADISVKVNDEQGDAVDDAVVVLAPNTPGVVLGDYRSSDGETRPYEIVQQNLHFEPHVLVAPRGASVAFPNRDDVRHHVYSFSPAKRFELTLYGQDESRSVVFDKAGVVAIGCNIHDDMRAYIYVYDTNQRAKLSANGAAAFSNVPAGEYTITIWHPRLKPKDAEITRGVQVNSDDSRTESVEIPLRPARRPVRASYN